LRGSSGSENEPLKPKNAMLRFQFCQFSSRQSPLVVLGLQRWVVCCAAVGSVAANAFTGVHYDLALQPNFATQTLHGKARIKLQVSADRSGTFELTSPSIAVSRVTVGGRPRTAVKTPTGWRIQLTPTQAAAKTLWLSVDYTAVDSDGLTFGPQHIYTAFDTCTWMPCAGPDLSRASINISLDIPTGYHSVASGERVADSKSNLKEHRKQRWQQARPYPLYTLGFAAGQFSEVFDATRGQRLRFLGAEDDAAALALKFKESGQVLDFFEAKAGVPLPHTTYTQVLLPGGVAQEASSFALIGKKMLDPILQDPQEDWVIAHEMAHQWWGNLITCAHWRDFWLNEGITVFMTAAWKQHRWGEAAYQREMQLARQRWQRAKDANFDKPLSWPGDYPSLSLKRSIHYSKGALFIDALRTAMGEAAFWDGLRRYTQANAGRSVNAADFERAMQSATSASLREMFGQWVGD
jgi:aminopeptidase N